MNPTNSVNKLARKYPDLFNKGRQAKEFEDLFGSPTEDDIEKYDISIEDVLLLKMIDCFNQELKDLKDKLDTEANKNIRIKEYLTDLANINSMCTRYSILLGLIMTSWLLYPISFNYLMEAGGWPLLLAVGIPYSLFVIWAFIEEFKIKAAKERMKIILQNADF